MSGSARRAKVKVRVRGWINAEAKWAVYGYTEATQDDADEVLADMMADADMGRPFWLVAEVEIPAEIEVPATEESER